MFDEYLLSPKTNGSIYVLGIAQRIPQSTNPIIVINGFIDMRMFNSGLLNITSVVFL